MIQYSIEYDCSTRLVQYRYITVQYLICHGAMLCYAVCRTHEYF